MPQINSLGRNISGLHYRDQSFDISCSDRSHVSNLHQASLLQVVTVTGNLKAMLQTVL